MIEARDVLTAPEAMLRALCHRFELAFLPEMLNWPKGPRASDGVWAPHWYGAVEQSTGFAAPRPAQPAPPGLAQIVAACQPHYETMRAHRLMP